MGWPKGKKRTGYIKKDGRPHLPKGAKIQAIIVEKPRYRAIKKDPEILRIEKKDFKGEGANSRPIVEPCPKCGWAYADGGYCERPCGWSRGIVRS